MNEYKVKIDGKNYIRQQKEHSTLFFAVRQDGVKVVLHHGKCRIICSKIERKYRTQQSSTL